MAQSGFTPIQLYHTSTALAVPAAGDMVQGELAINITDGRLYFKDASNNVTLLAVAGAAGNGTVTSVTGSGGTTGLTLTGGPIVSSGTLTLGGTLNTNNGGTGQTTYTDGQLLIGNTSTGGLSKATLTAGSGVTITNGGGTITIAAAGGGGGTVTGVTATFPATSTGGTAPIIGIAHGSGACTSSTGTGALVFNTGPTITLGNATGLPLSTGVTGTLPIANGGTGASDSGTARSNLGVPGLTGSGASGTWNININGTATNASFATSAGSATSATSATTATTATNVSGGSVNATTGTFSGAINSSGYIISSSGGGYARIGDNSVSIGNTNTGMYFSSNVIGWNINANGAATLAQNGDFTIAGQGYKPGGGSWAASSDSRLKSDVIPLTGALSKIAALNPVSYNWKYETNEPTVGFIAQEVKNVLPMSVCETKPTKDQKPFITDDKLLSIAFQNDMTAYLVGAIKELKAELDAAKSKIAALEAK